MGKSVHRFRASEARRTTHPVFSAVEKHWFTVAARDLPNGISTAANARDPVGLNRRVYRDVKESLKGNSTAVLGTFDLMNKGITILATSVKLVDKEKGLYEITIDDDEGGIVDGAHTAKIIWESNDDGTTPSEQHVEVYIRTGIDSSIISDIAKGLNTGIQVAAASIFNIDGVFDWLKQEIAGQSYEDLISWKESDDGEYDVRDLIGILEALNVLDFPNDEDRHPIAAYEKWSLPLEKFGADFNTHRTNLSASKYYRLRKLLRDGLALYDNIRYDFRPMHNASGGSAGLLKIVEEASARRGEFQFPFASLANSKYRLTKGAAYPILGAFRNFVEIDPSTKDARWRGGFGAVLKAWKEMGPDLVAETAKATKEIGRLPDQLGKSRSHWTTMHMKIQNRVLRAALSASEEKTQIKRK